MIKLNATTDRVEVSIVGNSIDISQELNALINAIKRSEPLQKALAVALTVDAIEKEHKENTDEMSEMLKRVFEKGNNNENLKS